jgi:hypothetical protein
MDIVFVYTLGQLLGFRGFAYFEVRIYNVPIPVAARSKAWVFGRSLTGIVGLNPTGVMDVCLL